MPRSPMGRMSGRSRLIKRNISAVHRPSPLLAVICARTSSSESLSRWAIWSSPEMMCSASDRRYSTFIRQADAFEIGRVQGKQLRGRRHSSSEALAEPASNGPSSESRYLLADNRVDEHAEGIAERPPTAPGFGIDRLSRIDEAGELSVSGLQRSQYARTDRGGHSERLARDGPFVAGLKRMFETRKRAGPPPL